MNIEKVFEFKSGKNDWNTVEIGVKDDKIIVRDEVGMLELEDGDVDELVEGIDQARRRLRENERRPTRQREDSEQDTADESEQDAEEAEETDEEGAEDEPQSTGLGPQMGGPRFE